MNAQRPVRRRIYEPLADINVTPLVDVMLVLLIVFMVTAPMLASGMKVSLPEATSSNLWSRRAPSFSRCRRTASFISVPSQFRSTMLLPP